MIEPTPSESRMREADIISFDKHWYIDATTHGKPEIRHTPPNGLGKVVDFFWRRKHRVSDLYWWASRKLAGEEMITFCDAIKHDDVPIENFPRKYQMQNGWSVASEDLKYLYEGPLVDETGVKY